MEKKEDKKKENMHIWQLLSTPPSSALTEIKGGRMAGKSDISPQWRYKVMTDVFGPCGVGWKYTIDKIWTEPGVEGQVFCFAQVSVYYKMTEIWSEPLTGIGGNMLIDKERAGLHLNDEGYKMAVTDALGTALKMLGVAAEIYLGNWDGSKYIGESSKGRTAGFESKNEGSTPSSPAMLNFTELLDKINKAAALPHLKNIWEKHEADRKALTAGSQNLLLKAKDARKAELMEANKLLPGCTRNPDTCGKDLRDTNGEVGCEITKKNCEYAKEEIKNEKGEQT